MSQEFLDLRAHRARKPNHGRFSGPPRRFCSEKDAAVRRCVEHPDSPATIGDPSPPFEPFNSAAWTVIDTVFESLAFTGIMLINLYWLNHILPHRVIMMALMFAFAFAWFYLIIVAEMFSKNTRRSH